jgi:purine-nucleoside phosphorylase
MSEPYSRKMIRKAKELALDLNIEVKDGIYLVYKDLVLKP